MTAPSTERANENAPLERGSFGATGKTHTADVTVNQDENKLFSTLQAKFALAGHTLYRTINADGTVLYLAGKWGYFRELKGLKAVAACLAMIGGAR